MIVHNPHIYSLLLDAGKNIEHAKRCYRDGENEEALKAAEVAKELVEEFHSIQSTLVALEAVK